MPRTVRAVRFERDQHGNRADRGARPRRRAASSAPVTALLTALVLVLTASAREAHAVPPETYLAGPTAGGSVVLVDPAHPATAVFEVTNPSGLHHVVLTDATFVSPTTIADRHDRWLVFRSGNALFRVSLLKSDIPLPVQLSSESNADQMCRVVSAVWTSSHGDRIVYELSGADGNCDTAEDNDYRMVRLDMGPTDPPVPAKLVVTPIDTLETFLGWLAIDGKELKRYDPDFAEVQTVTGFSTRAVAVTSGDVYGTAVLLRVDDSLRAYHLASGALSASLHTFGNEFFFSLQDATSTYVFDVADAAQVGGTSRILRVPSDGSAAATPLITETGVVVLANLTANRIAYQLATGSGSSIKTVPKAGGSTTLLDQAAGGDTLVLWQARDLSVYYNKSAVSGAARAVTVNEDGSSRVEAANALWVGFTRAITCDIATTDLCSIPDKLLRAEGPGLTTISLGGAALNSYAAGTNEFVATLGTLPQGALLVFALSLVGDKGLASVTVLNGFTAATSPYYFDAATPGSLVHVGSLPPPSSLSVSAGVNQPTFAAGQTVTATLGIANPGLAGSLDLYAGIVLPDGGTVAFFTGPSSVAIGSVADLASFRPIAAGMPQMPSFSMSLSNFFSYQWTGSEPRGGYTYFFLAVKNGALADGVLGVDEILALAISPFSLL